MVFLQSIQSVLTIILIIALGYLLQKANWFDERFSNSISSLITQIALPASIFTSVLTYLTHGRLIQLSDSLIYPAAALAGCYLIAYGLVRLLHIRRGRRGIFMNTIANANTVFIGLPLNIALFGKASLPYFLVYFIVSVVSTWSVGIYLILNDDPTKKKQRPGEKRRINWMKLLPPPLLGFIIGLIFLVLNLPVPKFLFQSLNYVGGLVTPLSLIYIGIVLRTVGLSSMRMDRDTLLALAGRFILSPLLLAAFIVLGMKLTGVVFPTMLTNTLIVQSAAPTIAVLPILAHQAHGDVRFAAIVVTTSTVLFVIVIPVLMQLVQAM